MCSLAVGSFVSASGESTVFDELLESNYRRLMRRLRAISKLAPGYSTGRLLIHFFSAGAAFVQFVSSVFLSIFDRGDSFVSLWCRGTKFVLSWSLGLRFL